ncbi:MAG: hypothetical protein ACM3OB_04630 [Acidobacteriota bacterium]
MRTLRTALGFLLTLLAAGAALAQVARRGESPLYKLEFTSPKLALTQPIAPYRELAREVDPGVATSWDTFRSEAKDWEASVDRRTGFVAFASGSGIPWLRPGEKADLATLEKIARGFLPRVAKLLGVDPAALALSRSRSLEAAPDVWFLDFDVLADATPIEGARVVFRVNHGNLIQIGSEYLPAPGVHAPEARLDRERALAVVSRHIGGLTESDRLRDAGSLHLIPIDLNLGQDGKRFTPGAGRGLARVWQFVFQRKGTIGTFRARVDAVSGELLELRDINRYAQATGGIYVNSPTTGPEVVRPFPYVDLSTGGFADSSGLYTYAGGTLTSTLNGQYVGIHDTCGSILLTADGSGNLAFGTSGGTNCTTPGFGGAGNTHASREQYYQTSRAMDLARSWLPGNTWLSAQLPVNVNLTGTCNAYWSPGSQDLNFFQTFTHPTLGACANSGETSGITLHEFGHGLDTNDGNGFSPDGGTGESVGDITSFMVLHDSCIGPGFWTTNCTGYGDACSSCTGIRDVDWGKHASNTPHTVANYSQPICTTVADYPGMCGASAHCEAYIADEAVWDLVNRDLPSPGTAAAWTVGERLFFSSRPTGTAAFTCDTSGATWSSNGCNAGSLWEIFRAIDDDDGNLANGTPHGGALWAAFNRHLIACATDPGGSTTFSGCTPPAAPTLTVTGGTNQVSLSWTAAAGAVYDVYRNEASCNSAFTRIASALATTSYVDTGVANGTTYYYQVVAYPAGNQACAAPPTTCGAANLAGPDPSIRPWGAALYPPAPPYWQTPDIWVDNNGNGIPNETGEPSRGIATNQLFARVTNIGNASTGGYRVTFAAKPYTTNAASPAVTIAAVDEAGPLAPGTSHDSNVTWDLTDAYIQSHFDPMFWTADHFCVQVTIGPSTGPFSDIDTSNDFAQNNFDNIPMSSGIRAGAQARFFVYNHLDHPAIASLHWHAATPGWALRFEKIADPMRIPLQPRQWLEVVAVATPDPGAPLPKAGAPILIDVSQDLDGRQVGGLTLAVQPPVAGTRPGALPAWLVGVRTGAAFPMSGMQSRYSPSVHFAVDLQKPLTQHFRLGLEAGYHGFAAKRTNPLDDLGVSELAVVGQWIGGGSTIKPTITVGVGDYRVEGAWKIGAQLGVGLELPIQPKLALTTGLSAHLVNNSRAGDLRWIDATLGLRFAAP